MQTKATGQMLFDEVCKRLDLQERDYFCISYLDDNGTRVSCSSISQFCSSSVVVVVLVIVVVVVVVM